MTLYQGKHWVWQFHWFLRFGFVYYDDKYFDHHPDWASIIFNFGPLSIIGRPAVIPPGMEFS